MARGIKNSELALAKRCKRLGMTRYDYEQTRLEAVRKSAIAGKWTPVDRAMSMADVTMAAEDVFGLWTHKLEKANAFNWCVIAGDHAYTAILGKTRERYVILCDGVVIGNAPTETDAERFINHHSGDEKARSTLSAPHVEPAPADLPDCGGDPKCTTHQGGSHNMTSDKECRR